MLSSEVESEPRRWIVLVPALVALGFGLRLGQPSVFPDEIGAILNGRQLVGLGSPSPWWYLAGYGALLAPILALTDDPTLMLRGIQLLNAALMVTSCLGLVASLRLLAPAVSDRRRFEAAALAMFSPAYIYFAGFAIADNAMVAMSAWLAPATSWLARVNVKLAIIAGFCGAAIAGSMHSRAALIPAAVAAGLAAQPADRGVRTTSVLLGTLVGRLVASGMLDEAGGSNLSGTGRQSVGALIGDNLNIGSVATLPGTLLGQMFALTVGSIGIVVLGVVCGHRLEVLSGPQQHAALAVVVAIALSVVSSVLFTNGGSGDFALYARYVEVSLPLVLALGWLGLLERLVRPPLSLAAAVAVTGLALVVLRGSDTFEGRIQRLNVAGLAPFIRLGDGLQPVMLGILGCLVLGLFAVLFRVRPVAGGALVLVIFAFAAVENSNASRAFVEAAGGQPHLGSVIESLPEVECVALDQGGLDDFWFQENLRLHQLDLEMPFWPTDGTAPACAELVVSSRPDLASALTGWKPIAVEPSRVQWLWASPRIQNDYSFDPLVGASLGAPLDRPAGSIEIAVVSASDQELVVELTILNSSAEPFVPAANLPGGFGGVQVGLEWRSLAAPSERTAEPTRVALPGLLQPGDSVTVEAGVVVLDPDLDQLLHVELVQEGVGWIDSIASSIPVEARP